MSGSKLRVVLLDEPTDTNPWKETIVAVESKNGVMGDLVEHNDTTIEITGILTEDDYDDEDCMGETLDDLRRIAEKLGDVQELKPGTAGDGSVHVTFNILDGMIIGGRVVAATAKDGSKAIDDLVVSEPEGTHTKRKPGSPSSEDTTGKKARIDDMKPMYSGDKLIPERFAEAKRVPKVPTSAGPRPYATIVNDESVRPLLTEMLGELMRLQKRVS